MRLTFPAGIFLGSFLLFLVQPMVAKALLPWFGGSAAVWATCLVFFQVLLLLGYLYAHAVATRLSARAQPWLHAGVVALALALLAVAAFGLGSPAVPGPALAPPNSANPVGSILAVLALVVGLPYLVLAANSPLLQAWYARCYPGRSPYRLYALSNAGSLLGLLGYPFLVEPLLDLGAQGWLWTALFAFGLGGCLVLLARRASRAPEADPASSARGVGAGARLLWLLLPAASTGLLLSVTNQLGLDVAAVPFLWMLPLAVYLVSFILCFERDGIYVRPLFLIAWAALSVPGNPGAMDALDLSTLCEIFLQLGLLGVGCMICHGELARARPGPSALTSFYAHVALGGALGGALFGLVAPLALSGPWEIHLCLACVSVIAFAALLNSVRAWNPLRRRLAGVLGALWLLGVGLALAQDRQAQIAGAELVDRSFFGVLRVEREDAGDPQRERLFLVHGETVHGYQFVAPERRGLATAYYGEASGLGRCLGAHPARRAGRPLRIGVVGLGVGTAASHSLPGDLVRFYEIDPLVVRLARGEGGFFSFLADSAGRVEVRVGDGRLLLEEELRRGEPGDFDVLVVDAFSSDAIPVHLLTEEAFRVYRRHLRAPTGVLALHLSNQALDLRPLAWVQGRRQGMNATLVVDPGDGLVAQPSTWMLLALEPGVLDQAGLASVGQPGWVPPRVPRPWTDRYSNLLDVIR